MRRWISSFVFVALCAGLLLVASSLHAASGGRIGFSGSPSAGGLYCTLCHGGGAVPQVTLQGAAAVAPGATGRFTLLISGGQADDTAAPNPAGGFNVSAPAGLLSVIPGAQDVRAEVNSGTGLAELTHTMPKPVDTAGTVQFAFDWTAPDTPCTAVTLYGAGNSVNGNGSPTGDNAATASFSVLVTNSSCATLYLPSIVTP